MWATTQSHMLRVRHISQVTIENHATTASNSDVGCVRIGTSVPTKSAAGESLPNGTFHQSCWKK